MKKNPEDFYKISDVFEAVASALVVKFARGDDPEPADPTALIVGEHSFHRIVETQGDDMVIVIVSADLAGGNDWKSAVDGRLHEVKEVRLKRRCRGCELRRNRGKARSRMRALEEAMNASAGSHRRGELACRGRRQIPMPPLRR